MKQEKEHLYELIIGQLLYDEHINIADQLYWTVQCTKNISPGCELKRIYDRQISIEAKEKTPCICGHPFPSCSSVSKSELESTKSRKKRLGKNRVLPEKKEVGKKKKGRPKKRVSNSHEDEAAENGIIFEDGYVDEFETLTDRDQVKHEVIEDASDYLRELDSALRSPSGDIGFSSVLCEDPSSCTSVNDLSNEDIDEKVPKATKKRGGPRNKKLTGKVSIGSKHKGITGKLIKKAMREARKEAKSERRRQTVFMCNYCLSKFSLHGLKDHLKTHCTVSGEDVKCNLCSKTLTCGNRILNFNSHLRLHGNMQHFLCTQCGMGFKSEGAYKYHREMHKDKTHSCEICKKTFKARGLLRSHVMTHSSVKSHICEYCAKGFRTATLLAKHVMIHTGEKPYRCEECGAEFRMSSHLRRHKDVHAGRKMYVCSLCNHAVYQRTNMRVHMKVHTGVRYSPIYVCDKCKMAFSTQGSLDEHATECRLTESAYEQQQRLGLQQKPAPLRVKRSRRSKDDTSNNPWQAEFTQSASTQGVPEHSTHVDGTAQFHHPTSQVTVIQPQAQRSADPESITVQQHIAQTMDNSKSNLNPGRLVQQQLTSEVQDLQQQLQHHQQSQFLQQLHAHQLYPQFYMQ